MFKESVTIAALFICVAASAPMAKAEPESATCKYLSKELEAAQKNIDETSQAYSKSAKAMDERMIQAIKANQNGESLDDIWPDVIKMRDQMLPQARAALASLTNGYNVMRNYIAAKCTNADTKAMEDRRGQGIQRYKNSIVELEKIRTDWHKQFYVPTPAECIALDEAHKNAEAAAKVYSLKNDEIIAAYRKARWDMNDAISLDLPLKKKWKTLLKKREAALPASEGYVQVMKDIFAPVQEGLDNNCVEMGPEQFMAFSARASKIVSDVTISNRLIQSMPTDMEEYIKQRNQTTSARVGIKNHTDYLLCYHLNGTARGMCTIKPRGTKIIELKPDSFGKPDSTLLITGGVKWEKDADGNDQVKEMKVCTKRTFNQITGSKSWTIKPGAEKGCEYPG